MIGIYGRKVDVEGAREPTLRACSAPDFKIERLLLLHSRSTKKGAAALAERIRKASGARVELFVIRGDPFAFEAAAEGLSGFTRAFEAKEGFDCDLCDYYVHLGAGSTCQLTALFLLVQSREIPAQLLAPVPDEHGRRRPHSIVDLEDPRYGVLNRAQTQLVEAEANAVLMGGVGTCSPRFEQVISRIRRVAEVSPDPILLGGETGAGKTFVASQIHTIRRMTKPPLLNGEFVAVNCAGLRGQLVQSTLFGHVKGAFTGADSNREGVLKRADGGLLFLDEIGELDATTQALLLKAIDEREFTPLGASKPVRSDFQLVAATNRDLLAEVEAKRFRLDLYARVGTWSFVIPPLRERPEDFEALIDAFLGRWFLDTRRRVRFSSSARARYLAFARSPEARWPWNLRDLQGSVRRLATFAVRGRVTETAVQEEIEGLRRAWRRISSDDARAGHYTADEALLDRHLKAPQRTALQPIEVPSWAHAIRVCLDSPTQAKAGAQLFSTKNPSDRIRKFLGGGGVSFRGLKSAGGDSPA